MNWRAARRGCGVFAVLAFSNCTERPTAPERAERSANVSPMCQLGCVGSDPYPDSAGVYIGDGINADYCFSAQGNDLDHDGIVDLCETWLMLTFDPELATSNGDDVGREPSYAVRWLGGDQAQIAYLISYYMDNGSSDSRCQWVNQCHGHYGDSEWIMLDVAFNWNTQHWVLVGAHLSQHDGWQDFYAGDSDYLSDLAYPSRPGSYPRVWVSWGKHANYASSSDCESGLPHYDHCPGNPVTYQRVGTWSNRNVGSSSHHLMDCVTSNNQFYSMNPPECYWSGARFDGWQDVQPDTDPYGPKLVSWWF